MAAHCPLLPPAALLARHMIPGPPTAPAQPNRRRKQRKKLQLHFLKALEKKCCVTRGKAKTNRVWQPSAAVGQGVQKAPAGCGLGTDGQRRGTPGSTVPSAHSQRLSWEGGSGGTSQRAFGTGDGTQQGDGTSPVLGAPGDTAQEPWQRATPYPDDGNMGQQGRACSSRAAAPGLPCPHCPTCMQSCGHGPTLTCL